MRSRKFLQSKRIAFLFLLVFSFCLVFSDSSAIAGIRIDNPKVRMTIAPGEYNGGEIKVDNTGREPISVRVYLEDWVYAQQDGGKNFSPKGSTPLSCAPWLTFYPADFELQAGATQIVRYTVAVPKGATGGHYCVMFFETGGGEMEGVNPSGEQIMVKVLNRLGALFYVEPEGTIQKSAELENLSLTQNLNDFNVSVQLKNTGNTDITAQGTFNVIDKEGFVYLRGEFEEVYTLPGDKAVLKSIVGSENLKSGDYDILLTIEFQNGGALVREAGFSVSPSAQITGISFRK